MSEDAAETRRLRGHALMELTREDLELFAADELEERILVMEAEIARARSQLARKDATRAAADKLFKL